MKYFIAALCSGLVFSVAAASAEPVASVVAVRGKAAIERGANKLAAQPKLGVEIQDTVATAEGGRVKILFIDDSVLTLAEKSRMSIDTFIHSRSDRGKSLFNLLDGKMRAVVGKTKFEVKTPTVVAAARGTIILFEVGKQEGRPFSRVTCIEGIVDLRKPNDAEGTAPTMLSAGESIVVVEGQPMPTPTRLSPAEIEDLKRATGSAGVEIKLPHTVLREGISTHSRVTRIPVMPSFDRHQPSHPKPRKVNIGVNF